MTKPFLSFEEQLNKLEKEKALIISDREYAKSVLMRIGYFGLIGGYKAPFKNPTTKKYRDGTRFEDIVALYKFDENLRELFLKYILKIERNLRSLLSYCFTEKYGSEQAQYLNSANYTPNQKYRSDVLRLVNTLNGLATKNSDYPYINHQRNTYGNVPLWVLVNAVSFGSLSKFYLLLPNSLKFKVSVNFDRVNERQLEQYLSVITKYRNVCAHNERLFAYKTKNDIPDTVLHAKLNISKKGNQYIYGKHDLFSLVIAFRYLLPDDDFKKFKGSLVSIIRHYFATGGVLSESTLLDMMGFPANWRKISTYKK